MWIKSCYDKLITLCEEGSFIKILCKKEVVIYIWGKYVLFDNGDDDIDIGDVNAIANVVMKSDLC